MTRWKNPCLLGPVLMLAGCGHYAVAPPPESFLPAEFEVVGTEPFWSASVTPLKLTYTVPDDCTGAAGCTGATAIPTRTDYDGRTVISATLPAGELLIVVTPGKCSDGMSDTVFPWIAERRLDGEIEHGCAGPAAE